MSTHYEAGRLLNEDGGHADIYEIRNDPYRVLKAWREGEHEKISKELMDFERKAYEKINNSSHYILCCYDYSHPRGVVLERCVQSVRSLLIERSLSPEELISFAKMAALGLRDLHRLDIIHIDGKCGNMLLTEENVLKLCDFGGSCVDYSLGKGKMARASPCNEYLGNPDLWGKKADIFALGSAFYRMETRHNPYAGSSPEDIRYYFSKELFPDLECCPRLGSIIWNCWYSEGYDTAEQVVNGIQRIEEQELPAKQSYAHKLRPVSQYGDVTIVTAEPRHQLPSHTSQHREDPPQIIIHYDSDTLVSELQNLHIRSGDQGESSHHSSRRRQHRQHSEHSHRGKKHNSSTRGRPVLTKGKNGKMYLETR